MELSAGTVVKAHGIRGELVVDVRTDYADERFVVGEPLLMKHPGGTISEYEVVAARWHQGRLLLQLAGITDRTAAEELRGATFPVSADTLHEVYNANEDEYHVSIIVGLRAVTPGDEYLGTVTDLWTHTPQDMLVVTDEADHQHLIPFVHQLIPEVNVEEGIVICDLPDGLWELS